MKRETLNNEHNGSVLILGVLYADFHKQTYYVEYRYVECHCSECRGAFDIGDIV
jgi:hypothetical protein